jgi:RecQ family ATP-dependent DNA helicase
LAVIEAVLEKKDTLALLPTGAGKSICFQVPTLLEEGICLVISPLIALMQDQVKDLQSKNISAIALGSHLSEEAQAEVMAAAKRGKYKFIYCSPEKLAQKQFQEDLVEVKITLFAIDEAHCISQWGYDFRPPYRKLSILKELFPQTPILAITASAIPAVQEDIQKQLAFKNGIRITDSFLRPNLKYSIQKSSVKIHSLKHLLQNVDGACIIYCNTRNNVSELAQLLKDYGYAVGAYHAGMSLEARKQVQDHWMEDKTPIVVCTSAFGMGINKGNVRLVVHFDIPGSIEQYYQEAGRAGRDGKASEAILLYQQNDWEYWLQVQEKKYPPIESIKKIYQNLADFVQLPIGIGEKQQFLFDFENFCTIFKWDKIMTVLNSDDKYLEMINKPNYKDNCVPLTLNTIADNIKTLLNIVNKQYKKFITFGNECYYNSVKRICAEANSLAFFDDIEGYTDQDLKNDEVFWNHHGTFIETYSRGYGYWLWKSFIIKQELNKLKYNDILIYCDAGCHININGKKRLFEYIDLLNSNKDDYGLISFQLEFNEYQYTKSSIFEKLQCDEYYKNMKQCLGGILLIKKNEHSDDNNNNDYDSLVIKQDSYCYL